MPKTERHLSPALAAEMQRIQSDLVLEVAKTSLRAVARAVGMTPSGLQNFLDGTVPYDSTIMKLKAWHFQFRHGGGLPPEEIHGILRQLVRLVGDPESAVQAVLALLADLHRASSISLPPWLVELQLRYAE